MKYRDVLKDKVVQRAEELGFMAFGENCANRRHFHWFMPDAQVHGDHTFSAHQYKGTGSLSYSVNHKTTSYAPRAIEWLNGIKV